MSGTVQLIGADEIRLGAGDRKRSGNLKFMYDRAGLFDRIERSDWAGLCRGSGSLWFVSRFVLIVDDEDSRNASIVGAAADRPGSCGKGYVGADTA